MSDIRRGGNAIRSLGILVVAGLLALAGCARSTPIPAGGQEVHVAVTDTEVRLVPSTVRAGDVYLVLDAPPAGSFAFVERARAGETPGPLTDADLARLARGDTEGTSIGGLDAGGCAPDQRAEDRGRMGPCGNVMQVSLAPGKYALVGGSPEGDPTTGARPPIGVLTVMP
jgi:hypothetical protein